MKEPRSRVPRADEPAVSLSELRGIFSAVLILTANWRAAPAARGDGFMGDCALPLSGGICPDDPPMAAPPGKRWVVAFDEEFSGMELDRTKLTARIVSLSNRLAFYRRPQRKSPALRRARGNTWHAMLDDAPSVKAEWQAAAPCRCLRYVHGWS
jgi:hypothetical protein